LYSACSERVPLKISVVSILIKISLSGEAPYILPSLHSSSYISSNNMFQIPTRTSSKRRVQDVDGGNLEIERNAISIELRDARKKLKPQASFSSVYVYCPRYAKK